MPARVTSRTSPLRSGYSVVSRKNPRHNRSKRGGRSPGQGPKARPKRDLRKKRRRQDMRHMTLSIGMLVLMMASRYGIGMPVPQQDKANINAMTVAQLEKAGDAARAQKDYPLAIQYFETAVRKDRKNSSLYNKLGLAELK